MIIMATFVDAGNRFRVRRQLAHDQRRTREDNQFISASIAIEKRADELLKTSKQLLKDCEACLPKTENRH